MLETVSKRLDASSFIGLSATPSDTQLYERQLAEHRELVLQREMIIHDIHSLPGFEFFQKPTPFNRLREAIVTGRAVIINVSDLGTDALVFDHNAPIQHVPLSKVNKTNLSNYTNRIAQKQTRADVTQERLRSRSLSNVWTDTVQPIFSAIGIPVELENDQVPATTRIFWYISGPLTFTPIHAAGPVSRVVVSSYITTLSSLAEAQKRQKEPIVGPPKLLAIAQPDTPEKTHIPHATDEVNMVTKILSGKGWPGEYVQRFDGAHATVDQVSAALDKCSWVHFACHAMQHSIDGMKSAFALHDGGLELSLIAAKRLTSSRFAFLSACQSASGLQESPGEAMHLCAGMQFAGFSSVIATLWSIRDEDAPIIAEHTYAYLLRNGLDKIDLTEAAAALNYAVSRLREDPNITLERWAPFVYFGV